MDDFYAVLNIPRGATIEEIKERYRFLAQAYHPDKFASSEHKLIAGEDFKKINEAYQMILQDFQRIANISNGKQVDLKGGMWFHEEGGFCRMIEDSDDKNAPFFAVSRFIRQLASLEPRLADWILENYPTDVQTESLTQFWQDAAIAMIILGKCLLAWRARIYGSNPSLETVSNALRMTRQGVQKLDWDSEAKVYLTDISDPEIEIECTWGELL